MESTGGWIKLHRSLVEHGHLQMPDKAFKLFMFLLLQVNHAAKGNCAAGEGWCTYQMILDAVCGEQGPMWSRHTISEALSYLEKHGYIQRIKTKQGAAQRIRIVNWDKYQGQSGAVAEPATAPPTAPVTALVGAPPTAPVSAPLTAPVTAPPTAPKQECLRMTKKEEVVEEAPAAQTSAPTSDREQTWVQWWEKRSASVPSASSLADFEKLQRDRVSDALIIAVGERFVQKAKGHPLRYIHGVLSGLVAKGVRTVEEWQRLEAEEERPPEQQAYTGPRPRATDQIDEEPEPVDELAAKARAQTDALLKGRGYVDPRERLRQEREAYLQPAAGAETPPGYVRMPDGTLTRRPLAGGPLSTDEIP